MQAALTLQGFLHHSLYAPSNHHTQPTHTCTPCITIKTVPWTTHNMQCYNPVIQQFYTVMTILYHSALEQPLPHTCTNPIRQQLHPWFHSQMDKCKKLTFSRNPSTWTTNHITSPSTWDIVTLYKKKTKKNRNKTQKSLPNANKHM